MYRSSARRVPASTAVEVNRRIAAETEASIRWHAAHREQIDRRLRELDEEWDIERAIEANAALFAFAGTALGAGVDRRWLALPAVVSAFLFQHALQGWCPPVPVLRRLGFRTVREIDTERYALKALRGDFGPIGPASGDRDDAASHALQAARL
jgi:hypothetical protein